MESMSNLMIFCGICRKFDKFIGKQQNAMASLETGESGDKWQLKTVSNYFWSTFIHSTLMLIKRRPPQFTGFVEDKHRNENVMITKSYIVSHIFYDRNLYECILWAFCTCLKDAWGCTPPTPCGMHCHCSTSWHSISSYHNRIFD